jgi:hypothetical protein
MRLTRACAALPHPHHQNTLKSDFPGFVVYPDGEKDLSAALAFASRWRIRVVAKCSGHDQNSRSTGRGVMQARRDAVPLACAGRLP